MTREIIDGIVTLTADEGAYITNGNTYSQKVFIGRLCNENDWHDATAEEYAAYIERINTPQAEIEDYENALVDLGVHI